MVGKYGHGYHTAIIQFNEDVLRKMIAEGALSDLVIEEDTSKPLKVILFHDTKDDTYFLNFEKSKLNMRYTDSDGATGVWNCLFSRKEVSKKIFNILFIKPLEDTYE
ncbi:hypothetical protein VOWphi5012_021 [Vibrio phage phi50-12]|uniref:Uncharacterized protein n=1 Tax=Vibrio phage phi50-12 TaxID=2654972 RepID=A0A5P8PRC0_9CAUD|nr:hypothetical protein KNU82_gp021 [Vibrio phage phi50-12]QFR59805.1 hypothetical protein VOWphi5012_021 [Vibrio phage phi50-12]